MGVLVIDSGLLLCFQVSDEILANIHQSLERCCRGIGCAKLDQSDEVEEVTYFGSQQLQTGAVVSEVYLIVLVSRNCHVQDLAVEGRSDVIFFKVPVTRQLLTFLLRLEVCEKIFVKLLHDAAINVLQQVLLLPVCDTLALHSFVFEGGDEALEESVQILYPNGHLPIKFDKYLFKKALLELGVPLIENLFLKLNRLSHVLNDSF